VYLAIEIWTAARCGIVGESEEFLRRCNTVSYLVVVETGPKIGFVEEQVSCGSKAHTVSVNSLHGLRIASFWKRKATTLFFESIELGVDRVLI